MALTDNLFCKIKAALGETVITDASANAFTMASGTGTATNYNDATLGNIWRISGGTRIAALSGIGNYRPNATTTVAIRFRFSGRGSDYSVYVRLGADDAGDYGIGIVNSGSGTGQLRVGVRDYGAGTGPALIDYTNGNVVTYVIRIQENGSSDVNSVWVGTTGRSGTSPDYTGTPDLDAATRALSSLVFEAPSGQTLDIIDFVAWNRGLTDAEAAAVADDIRGQIYPATATDGTGTGAPAATTLTAPTGTATGGNGTTNGTGTGTLAATSLSAPTGSASGTSVTAGTITIAEIRDLTTGTVRANETGITVIVNDVSTGALAVKITGETTDASGNCAFSSASLVAGTTYRCTTILSDGSEGTWKYTAA